MKEHKEENTKIIEEKLMAEKMKREKEKRGKALDGWITYLNQQYEDFTAPPLLRRSVHY